MGKKLPLLMVLATFLALTLVSFGSVGNSAAATLMQNTNDHMNQTMSDRTMQNTGNRTMNEPHQMINLQPGKKTKIKGVIVSRQGDTFTLRDQFGAEATVRLSGQTKFSKKYTADQLIRALPVEVQGRAESAGVLVADKIKFSDKDLIVARTVESQVVPVERRLGETETRLGETQTRLSQTEQNAQRLSGQMEELTEVANVARGGAKAAQESADRAVAGVEKTNVRISDLDNYDVQSSLIINFKVGSAKLTPEAKAQMDQIAQQAKNEKGFVIEVAGFASADGSEQLNRRLSERRADSVVQYLVEEHQIPLRRIVTPHGYGKLQPVADNSTREGRKQNRRVEVRLLVSRGLTQTTDGRLNTQ